MLWSCDTMDALGATTVNGQTLLAKNGDRPADECQPLIQHEHYNAPRNLGRQVKEFRKRGAPWKVGRS
jgi:hypothetical protein